MDSKNKYLDIYMLIVGQYFGQFIHITDRKTTPPVLPGDSGCSSTDLAAVQGEGEHGPNRGDQQTILLACRRSILRTSKNQGNLQYFDNTSHIFPFLLDFCSFSLAGLYLYQAKVVTSQRCSGKKNNNPFFISSNILKIT